MNKLNENPNFKNPLASFVKDSFPVLLADLREGGQVAEKSSAKLLTDLKNVMQGMPSIDEFEDVKSQRLALLDLTMLEAGLVHSGIASPQCLRVKIDEFASALKAPDVLSYEGYILENPIGTPEERLFMPVGTKQREQEGYFVNIHRQIESEMHTVVELILGIYAKFLSRSSDVSSLEEDSKEAVTAMENACSIIGKMFKLDTSSFEVFRQYFKTNPERNLPGPSGLFSATFQVLDRLLLDSSDNNQGPIPNELAFPQHEEHGFTGVPRIRQAQEYSHYRDQFLKFISTVPTLKANIETILGHLLRFRKGHKGLVKKYVPGALEGTTEGTSTGAESYHKLSDTGLPPVAALLDSKITQVNKALESIN